MHKQDSRLPSDKKHDMPNLVEEFEVILWLPTVIFCDSLGFNDVVTHCIPTGDTPHVAWPPRRKSVQKIIRKFSDSLTLVLLPWAAQIVLVRRECVLIIDIRITLTFAQHRGLCECLTYRIHTIALMI